MSNGGQFSIKSFPLKKCFDCATVLVIFMTEKVNNYTLMSFDYLGFIALCFGFSTISNSNNFLKICCAATVIFSSQSVQYTKCYTLNSCRHAVVFAIILHSLLSVQMLGDPQILVDFCRNWALHL